jgi:hypothetical protein
VVSGLVIGYAAAAARQHALELGRELREVSRRWCSRAPVRSDLRVAA